MFRSYRLQPATAHDGELVFEWDAGTGQVRGAGAVRVRALVDDAVNAGEVIGHPYPTPYEIHDPLHQPAELAVVLGQFWILDGDLAAAYPKADEEEGLVEIGEDGKERGLPFEPLH